MENKSMSSHCRLNDEGLFNLLGGVFEEATGDRVVVTMNADGRHHQPFGLVHGGVYCCIVETAASTGAAIWSVEQGNYGIVGVSNTTDFLRPHRRGLMKAIATPIQRSRIQQLWEVVITRDTDGRELSRGKVRLQNLLDPALVQEERTH